MNAGDQKYLTIPFSDMAKRGISLLEKLPDAECILARSLYYLSMYQTSDSATNDRIEIEKKAFDLYRGHSPARKRKSMAALTAQDFDNLIIAYHR
jgi:hypothetical protein